MPVQTKEEENEERPAQVLHSVPRLNDVSCSCTFKTTRSMPTRPWRSHVRSHRRRTVSLCSSSCMCYNGLRQEKLMPPKPKKRPMEKPAKAKIACMLQHIQNMSCIWQACKKPAEPEGPPPKKKACLWFGRIGGEPSLPCLPGRHAMDPTATAGPDVEGGVCLVSLMPWWFFCCPYQEPSSSSTPSPPPGLVQRDGKGWRAGGFFHDGEKWNPPGTQGGLHACSYRNQQALG